MVDVLEDAAEWLGEQFEEYVSRLVRYERAGAFCDLKATVGRTEYQASDGDGGIVNKWTDRDFVFPAEDLILAAGRATPEEGDKIHELDTSDSITRTYEVMPIPDEQCFRFCDPYRKVLRVHTKETAAT